ncbi:7869_t:CDS:2, partial [Entrophospora sp. SA101]
MPGPLENDVFLTQLRRLLENEKNHKVYITTKRYSYVSKAQKKAQESSETNEKDKLTSTKEIKISDDKEYPCIIRASCKRKKFSTLVNPNDLESFLTKYSVIMKAGLDSMKKKSRKKATTIAAKSNDQSTSNKSNKTKKLKAT